MLLPILITFRLHTTRFLSASSKLKFPFVQTMNPETNSYEWKEVDETYDYHQEIARSAFADMLHDRERNQLFGLALKKAIEKLHKEGKAAKVLDIGTGTGLLSMLAAKHGADTITACETFLPMANCAERITRLNKFENIKIIKKYSTNIVVGENADMEEKANILIAEVFDTELIGEGAIQTFNHAKNFLLEENSIVIPSGAIMYAQVVDSKLANCWNTLYPWILNDKVYVDIPSSIQECRGVTSAHDIQLSLFPRNEFSPISDVIPVFHFNWANQTPVYDTSKIEFMAKSDGSHAVVFMWWHLIMDTEGDIVLRRPPYWEHPEYKNKDIKSDSIDIHPSSLLPWSDHWMQAVYFMFQPLKIIKNEKYFLISNHDEYSLGFNVTKNKEGQTGMLPICKCRLHCKYSRTRFGDLNDKDKQIKLFNFLKKKNLSESIVVCLGNLNLFAILAHNLGAKIVYTDDFDLQLFDNNLNHKNFFILDLVKIIEDLISYSKSNTIHEVIVFSEPFFENSVLHWDNLKFWFIKNPFLKALQSQKGQDIDLLIEKCKLYPYKALLYGVAVRFDNLWKIRAAVKNCEGFDMTEFDKIVFESSDLADSKIEAQPLWEYPNKALSEKQVLAEFNVNIKQGAVFQPFKTNNLKLLGEGICDGIAMWVEYECDPTIKIGHGPLGDVDINNYIHWSMHGRQGLYLFNNRPVFQQNDEIDYEFEVNSIGELNVNFSYNKSPLK